MARLSYTPEDLERVRQQIRDEQRERVHRRVAGLRQANRYLSAEDIADRVGLPAAEVRSMLGDAPPNGIVWGWTR